MNLVCYIPARGSSAGVPRKNVAELGSLPLVTHTIRAARGVPTPPDRIIVSSEVPEVAGIAAAEGVTFAPRDPELAAAGVTVRQVLAADLDRLEALIGAEGTIVLLQPTSPFRTGRDIREAVAAFAADPDALSLVSVSPFPAPVEFAVGVDEGTGRLTSRGGFEHFNTRSRRQQYQPSHYPNGAIYIMRVADFREHGAFYHPDRTLAFWMSPLRGLDIDNPDTLTLARAVSAGMRTPGVAS